MTHASGAQDPTEAPGPGDRGWFQPPDRLPGADAESAQNGPGALDGVGDAGNPEDTAVFLRPGTVETEPSEQISVIRPAERSDDNELPTAIQPPLARRTYPQERDRPADITRPELILDDTVTDIAGSRGGRIRARLWPRMAAPHLRTPTARRPASPASPARRATRFSARNPPRGPTC
jgi:hypothetical protein